MWDANTTLCTHSCKKHQLWTMVPSTAGEQRSHPGAFRGAPTKVAISIHPPIDKRQITRFLRLEPSILASYLSHPSRTHEILVHRYRNPNSATSSLADYPLSRHHRHNRMATLPALPQERAPRQTQLEISAKIIMIYSSLHLCGCYTLPALYVVS